MTDSINFHTMLETQPQQCINVTQPQEISFELYEFSPLMNGGGGRKTKSLEFSGDIRKDYNNYLKQYEQFITESKKPKDNKEYLVTNDKLTIKQNGKVIKEIKRPYYIKTDKLVEEIKEDNRVIYNKIIKLRNNYTLNRGKYPEEELNKLSREYLSNQKLLVNINTYNNQINRTEIIEKETRSLASKKSEIRQKLQSLIGQIKEKNENLESVTDLCREYNIHNQTFDIDSQIRELNQHKSQIEYVIQLEKPKEAEVEVEVELETPPKSNLTADDISIGVETLDIEEDDLEKLAKENDYEELAFYENRPEIPEEDKVLPDLGKSTEEVKKDLMKPIKKKKKTVKKAKAKEPRDKNVKLYGSKKSKDGKVRRKLEGIPVREGDCIFPFNVKGEEKDDCVSSKIDDWCATKVNEETKEVETLGFCEEKK